jgi:uncharacterized protein
MSELIRFSTPISQIELREAEGDTKGKGRTLHGIAVPYNERALVGPDMYEEVLPGTFADSEHVVLRTEHGTTIGRVSHKETDEGLEIEARISNIAAGDEALTLIRDGVWDRLSVGFVALPGGSTVKEDGTIVRSKAKLLEVSLTGTPAYENAKVLALREAGLPAKEGKEMTESPTLVQLQTEVTQLREANTDLERKVSLIPTQEKQSTKVLGSEFRSAGEWLKAVADNDKTARDLMKEAAELRVFNGTVVGDTTATTTTWLSDAIRFVAENRIAYESFTNAALPPTGMTLEYLTAGASTLQVTEQELEGDVLAFGKLELDSASTGIKTYGGYSSMSFQAIRRSPINVVETTYNLLTAQAARRSNLAFIAALTAAAGDFAEVTRTGDTIDDWVDAIVDAEQALTDVGLGMPANAVLVSLDVFRAMSRVRDGNDRLLRIGGAQSPLGASYGTADVTNSRGDVLGLPVRVDANLAANTLLVYNRDAITVYGDATPTRLGPDDDITNLTSEVSVYFMQAHAVQFPGSVVSVVAGA